MTIEYATTSESIRRRVRTAFRARAGHLLAFLGCSALALATVACDSPTQPSRGGDALPSAAGAPVSADSAASSSATTPETTAVKGQGNSGDAAAAAIVPTTPAARISAQGPIPGVPAPLRLVQVAESYVSALVHPQRCNCKIFAQNVTTESSGGRINLPTTASAPNQFRWNTPGPYVTEVATSENAATSFYSARQGDIIQMKPRGSGLEHTAIVAATDGVGARLVEANYTSCKVTNQRYVTFAALNASHRWTLYRIN